MIRVIDIVYYCHHDYTHPEEVMKKHAPALGFADYLPADTDLQLVKHFNNEIQQIIKGKKYTFFKRSNSFWDIPFKTHRYIKSQDPDIVIVEGLIFPLQLIFLKLLLGKRTKIIAQHHGEKPFKGIKQMIQKIAARFTDRYLFTSLDNANPWVTQEIIKNINQCNEVLEASTFFTMQDKYTSRRNLRLTGNKIFLWVGRLETNKDPLTVLKAFKKYAAYDNHAVLCMIFQENLLLADVEKYIHENPILKEAVKLIGKADHTELPYWFSAADFYVSGSHKEGSGYALLEAMSCGCIPLVTDIPSFRKMTADGQFGFLYPPGNSDSLAEIMDHCKELNIAEQRIQIRQYFSNHLHFKNIAEDLHQVIIQLYNDKTFRQVSSMETPNMES